MARSYHAIWRTRVPTYVYTKGGLVMCTVFFDGIFYSILYRKVGHQMLKIYFFKKEKEGFWGWVCKSSF
jgi:hypothetical protein